MGFSLIPSPSHHMNTSNVVPHSHPGRRTPALGQGRERSTQWQRTQTRRARSKSKPRCAERWRRLVSFGDLVSSIVGESINMEVRLRYNHLNIYVDPPLRRYVEQCGDNMGIVWPDNVPKWTSDSMRCIGGIFFTNGGMFVGPQTDGHDDNPILKVGGFSKRGKQGQVHMCFEHIKTSVPTVGTYTFRITKCIEFFQHVHSPWLPEFPIQHGSIVFC